MRVNGFLNSSFLRVDNYTSTSSENSQSKKESTTAQKSEELTTSDKTLITKLQASDTAVRRHEAAHIAAGGGVVKSGANFTYQRGPDSKLYAIGGEVAIDTSEGSNPQETISKMSTIRRAALAPSDPSSTDYQVATTASMLEMKARLELSKLTKEENQKSGLKEYTNIMQTQDNDYES